MKYLNKKGLTAIEVLVCFAIISVIVISMINIINNYKGKQDLESYKLDITTYKNTLTKTIYNDIINNKGIKNIDIRRRDQNNPANNFQYTINLTYLNDRTATIKIVNMSRCFNKSEKNEITQKNQECTEQNSGNIDYDNSQYYVSFRDSNNTMDRFDLPKIYQLKFNDIKVEEINGIYHIKIGLWHSDFGEKYDVLNIITPNISKYSSKIL